MWRHGLDVTVLSDEQKSLAFPSSEIASRFQCVFWRLKGITILVGELYLWTGEGDSQRNIELLQHVTIVARTLGCPLLLFGDFQMTAAEMFETGWLQPSRLTLLTTSGVPTCYTHKANRDIDHCVVSDKLVCMLKPPEVVQ